MRHFFVRKPSYQMPLAKTNFNTRNPQKPFTPKNFYTKDLYARNVYALIGRWPTWPRHGQNMTETWLIPDTCKNVTERWFLHHWDMTGAWLQTWMKLDYCRYTQKNLTGISLWHDLDMQRHLSHDRDMTQPWPQHQVTTRTNWDMTRECPQTWQIHDHDRDSWDMTRTRKQHDRDITETRIGQDGLGIYSPHARSAALSI